MATGPVPCKVLINGTNTAQSVLTEIAYDNTIPAQKYAVVKQHRQHLLCEGLVVSDVTLIEPAWSHTAEIDDVV